METRTLSQIKCNAQHPTSAAVHESNSSSATNVPSANDQKPTDDKDAEEASTATLTLVDPSWLSSSSMCGSSTQENNGGLTVSDNFFIGGGGEPDSQ